MKSKLNGPIISSLSNITKRIIIIFIIFTLFFTISSLALSLTSGAPEEGSKNYLLVSSGNSLYKVSEDGTEMKRMSMGVNGDIEWGISISPDGKKILFGFNQSLEFGNYHESWWIMNSDGTGKKDLGIEIGIKNGSIYLPFFSPDGNKILFQPKRSYFKYDAWVMNTDGTKKINLSEEMKGGEIAYSSFSPDGNKILLELVESVRIPVNTEYLFVWIVNSDGTGKKAITKNLIGSTAGHSFKGLPPSFSPDGKKILLGLHFRAPKHTKLGAPLLSYQTSIWLMDTGGTGEEFVKDKKGPLGWLSFSPDGKKILFAFERGKFPSSYPSIWIMNSDGTEKRNLTGEMKGELWDVSLSPDGKKILFGFNSEIWTMNTDGTEKRKLAEGGDRGLSFSTDGKKIAFFGLYGRSFWVMNSDGTKKINLNETLGMKINNYAFGGTDSSPQISETNYFLKGSLHCPDTRGYPCNSCGPPPDYINHFKGFNVLTTNEDCYVKLVYQNGAYIGNKNNCEVIIKGEKWLGLEDESGTKLIEEINSECFTFKPANKFIERTMNFPGDNYKYEFVNEGKEFRLYLPRNREEAFKAVPWKNITVEIKNKETDKVFKYKFQKGIFPQAYFWSNGVENYGQCVWWTAKRWVEEVDSKTLFPFYPPSPQGLNVIKIDSNYQPKRFDVLIDYDPRQARELGHYGFVEKVEGDKMYISQFNWIKPGEVYNYVLRAWEGKATDLYYSNTPNEKYYFKYYYRK